MFICVMLMTFKIFYPISSPDDCAILQDILDNFSSWFNVHLLSLCPGKCSIISFTRSRSPITYRYSFNNVLVSRWNTVKDLGVLIDASLSFNHHIDTLVCKARKTIGTLKRVARDFHNLGCLKPSSVPWSGHYLSIAQ